MDDRPKLLSSNQVAEKAGISLQALEYHVRRGNLPAQRVGRFWVFFEQDVDKWLSER